MTAWAPLVLVVLGVAAVVGGGLSLRRRAAERRFGELAGIDAGRPVTLRAERYRLVGRPDLLRRGPDGTLVPVELKHRPPPRRGPFRSHTVQLGAYCLLVEETSGRPPPFGVLRYADAEVVIPYDRRVRREVLDVLESSRGPYDGGADPSPTKCRGCPWSPGCDASLAGTR